MLFLDDCCVLFSFNFLPFHLRVVDSVEVLLNLLGVKPSGLGPFSALPPLWCFNNNNNKYRDSIEPV